MRKLIIVTFVVFLLVYCGDVIDAQTSPLESPVVKPPGLENCPPACIENLACVGFPTCNPTCVFYGEIDQKYISPTIDREGICHFPESAQALHSKQIDKVQWWRVDDWMDQYILLQNQYGDYCLPEFSYCEGW